MARPVRIRFKNAFYHVYNRGVEKQPIFFDERDRRTFLHLLGESVGRFQLRLFAYCLMGNHFHLFLQTPQANLHQALQYLQGCYAQYLNIRHERIGPLFQSRYKSPLVEEDAYAFALTRYIHRNPLEAGIVEKIDDYRWSSYPSYIGKLPKWEWLETGWLLLQLHRDPAIAIQFFQTLHHMKPIPTEVKAINKMGPYLGNPKKA